MTGHDPTDRTAHLIGEALAAVCISPNETDRNGEPANVVDGLFAIARALNRLAAAMEGGPRITTQG